jgi:prepilin signal peptidase PulO-like enzyme (type II secretory pathway)
MLSYRLIATDFWQFKRSVCTQCRHTLSWYDLIPLFSFFLLKGRCRYCHELISWLYPALELLTLILSIFVYLAIPADYWLGYGLFFSALLVTLRTDSQFFLISRFVTLYLIPVAFLLSWHKLLPLPFWQSLQGAVGSYGILWVTKKSYWLLKKQEGLGQGDLELLACIGAFIGLTGAITTLFLGALGGSLYGIALIGLYKSDKQTLIPFGLFLAIAAFITTLAPFFGILLFY